MNLTANSIVILAAGQGKRMYADLPKILHDLSGRSMIDHIVQEAKVVSDDIHIVLYHQADRIEAHLQDRFLGLNFHRQDHDNYPGTGGALRNLSVKYDRLMVINGDMPLIRAKDLQAFLYTKADAAIGVMHLDDPTGYGRVLIGDQGQVTGIIEQKDTDVATAKIKSVNAGLYSFDRALLEAYLPKLSNANAQKEYYLTDVIGLMAQAKKSLEPITVSQTSCQGINNKYELALADEVMQDRIKAHLMMQGVQMQNPKSIYCEVGVQVKGQSCIEQGVVLKGQSIIENAHIKANSYIQDAIIVGSSIGPMAHIRPKSVITDSHIGNFVEVKNSTLTGVKAGHLSYLGDTTANTGTNVGAGCITCNYDGKAKHQTHIGKNVFLGSDTQLIAPLTIEDDVLIAAGSTITKDIPKGHLAITRSPLKLIKDYFYRFFDQK